MRPGRPKAYSSGLRWVRSSGKNKSKPKEETHSIFDVNQDGEITKEEITFVIATYVIVYSLVLVFIISFFSMAYWGITLQKEKERELRLEKQMKSNT